MQQNLKFYYTYPAYTTSLTVLSWAVMAGHFGKSLSLRAIPQDQCGLKTRKRRKPQTNIKIVALQRQTRENTSAQSARSGHFVHFCSENCKPFQK